MEKSEEIFFIYDTDAMQSEYDTIEGSILFQQPKSIVDDEGFALLVGQLVGIVAFSEDMAGSVPSVLRLEKMKFAVVKMQSFLLFFGSSQNGTLDVTLKNRLDRFISVFSLFHGSFALLKQQCENDVEKFRRELNRICQCYLPFAQSYNSSINDIFTPIPTIEFNKASYVIFMKANEVLESCQRRENVLCGALFSEERLVTSQIPSTTILNNLTLLKPNQKNLPAETFDPGFGCPYGIKIFKVYVTEKQYRKLISAACMSPYKKDIGFDKNKNLALLSRKRISKLPLHGKKATKEDSLRSMRSKESLISSKESLISDGSFDSSYSDSLERSDENLSKSVPTAAATTSDHSLAAELSKTSLGNIISNQNDLPIFRSLKIEEPEFTSEQKNSSCSLDVNKLTNNMHELHLYIQGHSSSMLVLLMQPSQVYHFKKLKSLWELVLPRLGDIEAQIKSLISSQEQRELEMMDTVRYLQYDKKQNAIVSINLPDPVNSKDFASLEVINRIHDQFQMLPSLRDVTIKSSATAVYAHQSSCQEIFYQQRGNYQPIQSPPSASDVTWTFDQRLRSSKLKQIFKGNVIL